MPPNGLLSSPQAKLQTYDFRRPHKFNREHVRALHIVGETFARRLASGLSTTVRAICQITLHNVSQLTYDEYIRAIPLPACLAVIALQPLPGTALLHIPVPVLLEATDRLLGGPGGAPVPDRPLTEIEMALARTFQELALKELRRSFESVISLTPELLHQEANPQFAQVAVSTDLIVSISVSMRIGNKEGAASICIPYSSLQPALDEMSGHLARTSKSVDDPERVQHAIEVGLDKVPVPVTVRFNDVSLTSAELNDLRCGDVLALHHGVDEPLSVDVGGVRRFSGRPGHAGRRLACVLVGVVNEDER